MKSFKIYPENLYDLYIIQNLSFGDISKILGCGRATVQRAAKRFNICKPKNQITENRLKNKASKRDSEMSKQRLLSADEGHRLISNPGEVPFTNYIKIDNTELEPEQVAKIIMEAFDL